MPQRAHRRSVRGAGAARQARELHHRVARASRPEAERWPRRAEDRNGRRLDGLRQMQRRAVVGHEHGGSPNELGRLPERERAARVRRPPPPATFFGRHHHLRSEGRVLRPGHRHDRRALRQPPPPPPGGPPPPPPPPPRSPRAPPAAPPAPDSTASVSSPRSTRAPAP